MSAPLPGNGQPAAHQQPPLSIAEPRLRELHLVATKPEEYEKRGLGPLSAQADPRELYLDMVKRAVTNILYEDPPDVFYDHRKQATTAEDFDLGRRVLGEDVPSSAHTMVGIKRLDNIQHCLDEVLRNAIPGDLVETGVMCGGSAIFMRAALKAYGIEDRRVFACDTFVPPRPPTPLWLRLFGRPLLVSLASLPGKAWKRWLFMKVQTLQGEHRAFPYCEDPGDDLIEFTMWMLRHPGISFRRRATGLANVRSHFARYGLLDDQVVFLKGFFAETLPTAPLKEIAVMRLDGDTYESTRDVLSLLYHKLSPGGFCIIDDFNAWSDCRRAVEEYREKHDIRDPIHSIDNIAVYWQKS